jgi:hypothetical protein
VYFGWYAVEKDRKASFLQALVLAVLSLLMIALDAEKTALALNRIVENEAKQSSS